MSTVILDAMECESSASKELKEVLEERGEGLAYFRLEDMDIVPCRSCGACGFKSPGKCIIKDDMHGIMQAIAKSSMLIMLTPVRFGGYSSCLKKAADKFMNLCLPTYTVKNEHLLHPARYGNKSLIGIGIYEGSSKDQEESFKKLVGNNALNLQYTHKTLIIKPFEDMERIRQAIGNVLKEVC